MPVLEGLHIGLARLAPLQAAVALAQETVLGACSNAVWIFGPHPPARTTVEAARLPKDSLVEIDAIALE